jgi:hypothetical protein
MKRPNTTAPSRQRIARFYAIVLAAIAALGGCSSDDHTPADQLSELKSARLEIMGDLKDIVLALGPNVRAAGASSGQYFPCGKIYQQATASAWQYKTAASFTSPQIHTDGPDSLAVIRNTLQRHDWAATTDPRRHRSWAVIGKTAATGVLELGQTDEKNNVARPPEIRVTLVSQCYLAGAPGNNFSTSPENISHHIGF